MTFYRLYSNNDTGWADTEQARQVPGFVPQGRAEEDRAEDNFDYDAALKEQTR